MIGSISPDRVLFTVLQGRPSSLFHFFADLIVLGTRSEKWGESASYY